MNPQATSAERQTDESSAGSTMDHASAARLLLGFQHSNFKVPPVVVVFGKMGREENRREKYVELKSVQLKGQRWTGMTFDSGLCLRGGYKGVTNVETRPPHVVPVSLRQAPINRCNPQPLQCRAAAAAAKFRLFSDSEWRYNLVWMMLHHREESHSFRPSGTTSRLPPLAKTRLNKSIGQRQRLFHPVGVCVSSALRTFAQLRARARLNADNEADGLGLCHESM